MRTHGKDGSVSVGADVLGEVRSWDLDVQYAPVRAVTMGAGFVGHGVGQEECSGTVTCYIDNADAAQTALRAGGSVALELYEQGVGSGLPSTAFTSVFITGEPRTVDPEDFNTVVFSWVADSAKDDAPQA